MSEFLTTGKNVYFYKLDRPEWRILKVSTSDDAYKVQKLVRQLHSVDYGNGQFVWRYVDVTEDGYPVEDVHGYVHSKAHAFTVLSHAIEKITFWQTAKAETDYANVVWESEPED